MIYDSHVHTCASFDGISSGREYAEIARLEGFCLTDHLDLGVPEEEQYDPNQSLKQAQEARKVNSSCLIQWGVELGQAHHKPDLARSFLNQNPYDFVLGSVHNLKGMQDFYFLSYPDLNTCRQLIKLYLDELLILAKTDFFDSLSHLTYPLRYIVQAGFHLSFLDYEVQLRELFHILIDSGKALEVNTSGFSGPLGCTLPSFDILQLYRDCGGSLLTLGSDAHEISRLGNHLASVHKSLKDLGFQKACYYVQRQPVFYPLDSQL